MGQDMQPWICSKLFLHTTVPSLHMATVLGEVVCPDTLLRNQLTPALCA